MAKAPTTGSGATYRVLVSTDLGGRFRRPYPGRHPNDYVDLGAPAEVCQATISQWRRAFLRDWKGRWDRYDEPAA